MIYTYRDALNYAVECGLTRAQAVNLVHACFGSKAISRIERYEAEHSPEAKKQSTAENQRRRALKLWREMRQEVRKKRDNALLAAAARPHEADYHTSYAKLCDKVHVLLSRAETEEQKGEMRTPIQVGAARGLPNNGVHWPDWVPEHIKAHFEAEALRIGAARPNKARPPRPFYVPARDDAEARKRSLKVALEMQHATAKERRKVLMEQHPEPDANIKRQLVFIMAEERACNRALSRLDSWPRTRPVPVNPMDLASIRMPTLEETCNGQPSALLEQLSLAQMWNLAGDIVSAAQETVSKRKKYLPPADRMRAAVDAQAFEKD